MNSEKHAVNKLWYLVLSLGFYSLTLHAQEFQSGLDCKVTTNTLNLLHCVARKLQLCNEQAYESELVVRVELKTGKASLKNLAIEDQASQKRVSLTAAENGILKTVGKGPFTLVDGDPKWTAFVHLPVDGGLRLRVEEVTPSQNTRKQWVERRQALQQTLVDARVAKEGFALLASMLPLFKSLHLVLDNLVADLKEEHALQRQIIEGLLCEGKNSLSECSLLERLAFAPQELLSNDEKKALLRVQSVFELFELNAAKDQSLGDLLSDKQAKLLLGILHAHDEKVRSAADQYRHFAGLELRTRASLSELYCLTKATIAWDGGDFGPCL